MDRTHAIEPRRAQLGETWVGPRCPDCERATVYNDGTIPIALRLRWGQFVVALGVIAAGGSLLLPACPFPETYIEGFGAGGSFSVLASRGA